MSPEGWLGESIRSWVRAFKWDMVHYDVQLIGGIVLHQGKVTEMKTGEGKNSSLNFSYCSKFIDRKRVTCHYC